METILAPSEGELLLNSALRDERPVVAILGQDSGWSKDRPDPLLSAALEKAQRQGAAWSALLTTQTLTEGFYDWLAEKFLRRTPSAELLSVADAPFSAGKTGRCHSRLRQFIVASLREEQPRAVLVAWDTLEVPTYDSA